MLTTCTVLGAMINGIFSCHDGVVVCLCGAAVMLVLLGVSFRKWECSTLFDLWLLFLWSRSTGSVTTGWASSLV